MRTGAVHFSDNPVFLPELGFAARQAFPLDH
jgi:hypothetical protein